MFPRFSLLIIGIFGLSGVVLGALGAHELHDTLTQRGTLSTWETASLYHLVHTAALLALLAIQSISKDSTSRYFAWATRCWTTGILLFSGSLYILAVGGPKFLGPITPLGGLFLILGWGALLVAGLKQKD